METKTVAQVGDAHQAEQQVCRSLKEIDSLTDMLRLPARLLGVPIDLTELHNGSKWRPLH